MYILSASESFAAPWRFSSGLHCPDCDISYKDPSPSTFSFNSPIGACETCRGFGRSIGVDYGLVIPDSALSLRQGAVKPWQTESYKECQADLMKFARKRAIPIDTPWRDLTEAERAWVIEGEGEWTKNVWYGVRRFFAWLETKAYKMHIRVLLSRYRSYTECSACRGARLKPEALLWRVGKPGINIREMMLLPIDECRRFFAALELPAPLDEAADLLLREIRTRLQYLTDVGLGYLNLDRQSRTLSGGEVQRINLTTALGTSLVNTLFVLDEPSIGLHPRDVGRIVGVMHRLRDAGNTLVVVEHDPKVMQAADRVLDIGPGPGEHGGEIVFFGPIAQARCGRGIVDRGLSVWPQARRDTAHRHPGPPRRGRLAAARRCRAQPQAHRCRISPPTSGVRHGSQRIGQVHLGARHSLPGAASGQRQTHGESRPPSRSAGRRADRRRRHGGPEPYRPHHALQSRKLCGRLRRDSRFVRADCRRRANASTRRVRSASTRATAAVRRAAATASSTWRCNSSRMCTSAVPIATAGAIAQKCSK